MNLEQTLQKIRYLMTFFVTEVKAATAMQQTDINKVSENVLIPLLAEVYGYKNLKNLNFTEGSNFPSVDLGDETAKVAFQITATPGIKKVKHTLSKFIEYKLYEKYDRLIIYILTEKQNAYSDKEIKRIIQSKFCFDTKKDIWDYRNILGEVNKSQIEQAREVEKILEANFGEGRRQPEWKVVDKVEQIVKEYTQFFVGRSEEIQKLDDFLAENSSGIILVTAGAGFGKTALLANWMNDRAGKGCFIAYHFFAQRDDKTRSVKSAYRNLLRQLYIYYELSYEQPPKDEEDLKIRLYNLLREHGTREGKPLVIVLDGLDEAERPFSPPFPTPLPDGVFVIASARAEEGEEPKYLEHWTDNSQWLHLKRLPSGAIAHWIRQAGEGKLAAFAEDTHFVAQLDEITEGFPLYLRYLTEELIQAQQRGEDVWTVLTRSPKKFGDYVQKQFEQLAQVEEIQQKQQVQELFALLSVALGALSKDDVRELTGLTSWNLAALPWQATRWFSIQTGFYSFAHPLLAKEFQGALGHEASSAKEKLIKYCSYWQENWQKHQSRYALRHYAEHLREAKQWEDLYAIARDKNFAATQQKHLPDEPDLPLKTVQTALLGAAEKDDAGAMAEFMLVHAWQLVQTTSQESPLDALRSGSLDRALALADLYEIERCALWYLLLAWELKDTERLNEAQATLEKLRKKKLVRGFSLSGVGTYGARASYAEYAAYLLAYVSDISKDVCTELTQCLLDDYQKLPLCKTLSARGHLPMALEVALSMDDCWKVQALADIAVMQAQIEDKTAAQNTLSLILKTAQPIDDKWKLIAAAQAKIRDFDAALEAVQKIENKEKQVWALGKIAIAQAQVRQKKEARANLEVALETARKVDKEWSKAHALQDVAIAQAEAGEFINAMETAKETGWECTRGNVLHSITKFLAWKGDFNTAFWVVNGMPLKKPDEQSRLLEPIAEAFAQHQNFNAALSLVGKVFINQGHLIGRIAAKMAQVGLRDEARAEFTSVLNTSTWFKPPQQKQAEALGAIAQAQAEVGQKNEARATFTKALEVAYKINNQGSKDWALQTIAEKQVRSGEHTAAFKTAQMIEDEGRLLTVLPVIAVAYGQVGDKDTAQAIFTHALEITRKLDNEPGKEAILREIAKGQARIRDFDAALETAQENGRDFTLPQVLGIIGQMQAQDDKTEAARSTFTAAVKEAKKLGKSWEYSWTLQTIAEAQAQTQSEEFLNAALKTAREIDTQREKVKAMQEIAKIQIQLRQFPAALEITREIQAEGEQAVEVLAIAAESQVEVEGRGAVQETYATALKLVQEIRNDGIEARALETVAQSQAKSSFGSQAIRTTDLILINRYQHLPNVAAVLAEIGDKQNFKHLLIPCAYYLDAACEICGHLARLYPEKAEDIAKVVSELN